MKIKQAITDYIMKSILTTKGDMVVRGDSVPEKLVAPSTKSYLVGMGAGEKPAWTRNLGDMDTQGDMIYRGAAYAGRLAAVAVGSVLKSKGIATTPAWEKPSIADLGFQIGHFAVLSSCDEVISGLGFAPKLVLVMAADGQANTKNMCWGFDTLTLHECVYFYDSGVECAQTNSYSICIRNQAAQLITGVVSALGGDGFTMTFTLTGARQANVAWLAIG